MINKRVSTQDPDQFTYAIGFALNLPDTWFGRFEMMGGGGTDGRLNADPKGSAGVELNQGWAVAADDGGHEDSASNAVGGYQDDDPNAGGAQHFGVDEQARVDYGYNGIEKTATISKMIIADYYGQPVNFSYIMGCSNGGRDGMVASQKFPTLFDGVVSQNPGFNLPQAGIAEAWNEQALAALATSTDVNGQPFIPDTFPPQDLEVASAAILSACDALDGLVDGIIDDFHACTNDKVFPALAAYTCGTGTHGSTPHGGTCLTGAQVGVLKKIYGGPVNSKGKAAVFELVLGRRHLGPADGGGRGLRRVECRHRPGAPCQHRAQSDARRRRGADDLRDATGGHTRRRTDRPGSLHVPLQLRHRRTEDLRRDEGVSPKLDGLHDRRVAQPPAIQGARRQADHLLLGERRDLLRSIDRTLVPHDESTHGREGRGVCQAVHGSQHGPLRRRSGDKRLRGQRAQCDHRLGRERRRAGAHRRGQSQYRFSLPQRRIVRFPHRAKFPDRRHAAALSLPADAAIHRIGHDERRRQFRLHQA